MKMEQMVGTRLPSDLVRALELIENVEQADRSTTVRRLLSKAIHQWKLEHYANLYGESNSSMEAGALRHPCACSQRGGRVLMGNDGLRPRLQGAFPVRPRRSPPGLENHTSKQESTVELPIRRQCVLLEDLEVAPNEMSPREFDHGGLCHISTSSGILVAAEGLEPPTHGL